MENDRPIGNHKDVPPFEKIYLVTGIEEYKTNMSEPEDNLPVDWIPDKV